MKRLLAIALLLVVVLTACSANMAPGTSASEVSDDGQENNAVQSVPQIYLYGELHAQEKILEKELELWRDYYHNHNMRHLFVEMSYYGAEYLNLWMQSDSDDLLNIMYHEWEGAAMQSPTVLAFFKQIKAECPETVFHGTDIGHQYGTTGRRFLAYLESNQLTGTAQHQLTLQAIEQGERYRVNGMEDHVYRENTMTKNFVRTFNALKGESIMGIYGGAHTQTLTEWTILRSQSPAWQPS